MIRENMLEENHGGLEARSAAQKKELKGYFQFLLLCIRAKLNASRG